MADGNTKEVGSLFSGQHSLLTALFASIGGSMALRNQDGEHL
jgi:hypothetical protein